MPSVPAAGAKSKTSTSAKTDPYSNIQKLNLTDKTPEDFKDASDYIYKHGIIKITGRADDVIKIAGRRITTSELESAVNNHPEISESAVIGIPDEIKGSTPLVFATYRGVKNKDEVTKEIEQEIKKSMGPIATPKKIYLVHELPKTRSGKIMRTLLKKLYFNENLGDISTLSNPETIEAIKKQITTNL